MTDFTLGPGPLIPEFEQIKSDIGIVENGNTATHAIPSGYYVIWKGDLYVAKTDIPIGTTLSAASGGNLTAKTNGIGEVLANCLTNSSKRITSAEDLDDYYGEGKAGMYYVQANVPNSAFDYSGLIVIGYSSTFGAQFQWRGIDFAYRVRAGSPAVWSDWTKASTTYATKSDTYLLDGGTVIPENANLDDYKTPGKYGQKSSSVVKTMSGLPYATGSANNYAFNLVVENGALNEASARRQTLYFYNSSAPWVRYFTSSWSPWQQLALKDDVVTVKRYSVTTVANTAVSPFGAFVQFDVSAADRTAYGSMVSAICHASSTNPAMCMITGGEGGVLVYSNSVATFNVDVVFSKNRII